MHRAVNYICVRESLEGGGDRVVETKKESSSRQMNRTNERMDGWVNGCVTAGMDE